ncbi:MAG: glycosyltransferase family 4 protein [Gammaproteobacteria bacterium]|nr:glycosyltransferase family 4 protein [Gammaproteobacteria bacterium]
MPQIAVFVLGAACAALLTGGVRRYALARGVIDRPNARSLHATPVPRGGGIAIVIVAGLVHAYVALSADAPRALGVWWWGALVMAALGFLDDHRPLGTRLRLAIQLAVALACVLATPWPPLVPPLEVLRALVLAVGVAWLVNLYNFMDGSDGIAGTQAIVAAGVLGVLYTRGGCGAAGLVAAGLAGASLGFTWWNWAPARIFMGDAGSYYLGFQFASLGVAGAAQGCAPWPLLILISPFVTDATATLVRRMLAGEPWFRAHRCHAYQLLVRGGWPHQRVATALAVLCFTVSVPLACLAAARPGLGPVATLIAYALAGTIWGAILRRGRALLRE